MLSNATLFVAASHHKPGDILQEHKWDTPLIAELNKVGAFRGRLSKEHTIVGNNTNRVTHPTCEAANKGRPIVWLELMKLRAINQACNHFMDIERCLGIGRNHACEFRDIVKRFFRLCKIESDFFDRT